jgi:hypothetical protein
VPSNSSAEDDSNASKIDDEITYHKKLEVMALRAGDFTKAEHNRLVQEIFSAMGEKSQQQQQP